ncbi:hypothetical protein [Metabacillus halosaccharovorans]|uniref:hypothetical protein n=1 Tax=Metabacillus halosaccharovorans TaxID=930124 RepID=UPI0037359B94
MLQNMINHHVTLQKIEVLFNYAITLFAAVSLSFAATVEGVSYGRNQTVSNARVSN